MISYSLVLMPYSANDLADDQLITINRYLISNVCLTVTKREWLETWHREGWRPVDVYAVSNEKIFSEGDLIWSKIFGISNYSKGMPIYSLKKVVLRPTDLKKFSASKLSSLLDMGDTLSLAELRKNKLVLK
jgi:hypothetical protein